MQEAKSLKPPLVEGIVDIYPANCNKVITRLQKEEFLWQL